MIIITIIKIMIMTMTMIMIIVITTTTITITITKMINDDDNNNNDKNKTTEWILEPEYQYFFNEDVVNQPVQVSMHHTWWRHQMETFSALLALCAGNFSPVNSPRKGQWRRVLIFSLICAWTNDWVNEREASDLRRHCAQYNVTVMCNPIQLCKSQYCHQICTNLFKTKLKYLKCKMNEKHIWFFCVCTLFSCEQAARWMVQFIRPSVHHTFFTLFPSWCHHEIFRNYYQWQKWCPCKKSWSRSHRSKPNLAVSGP